MITLSIIAYIIISLIIAWRKYDNPEHNRYWQQINPCYENGKKSIIYGFLCIPKYLIICGTFALIMYGFCWMLFGGIKWIFINMP